MKIDLLLSNLIARFLRAFFYLLYNPLAWSYDLVAATVSWGRWKQWVFSVLPYLKGPLVLEIGHGPGHLQAALLSKGVSAFGLDPSHHMGRQAQKRLTRSQLSPRLVRGYAQTIPFDNEVFDQIVATFPTNYMHEAATLAEIFRVLKFGGTLVVLPVAWITGKRLSDRGTAALFKITGQAPEWDEKWLAPFSNAGFSVQAELIKQESWSLVIIVAQKPNLETA